MEHKIQVNKTIPVTYSTSLNSLCLLMLSSLLFLAFNKIHAEQKTLTIIHTADTHCQLSQINGGWIKLGNAIDKLRTKAGGKEYTLLIDCGDTTQGSPAGSASSGKVAIKILNSVQFDAWIPGNHDFDYGIPALDSNITTFHGDTLAANLKCNDLSKIQPWAMYKRNGMNIAVIGLTASSLSASLWLPESKLITIEESEPVLGRTIAELRPLKPDVIILAAHHGLYGKDDSLYSLAAKYPEIDVIIGAHTHQNNPGMKLSGAWYSQSGSHAENFGSIVIQWDTVMQKITKIYSKLIPVDSTITDNPEIKSIIAENNHDESTNCKINNRVLQRLKNSTSEVIATSMADAVNVELAVYSKRHQEINIGLPANEYLFQAVPYEETIGTINVNLTDAKIIMYELSKSGLIADMAESCYGFKVISGKSAVDCRIILVSGEEWLDSNLRKKIALPSFFLSGGGGKLLLLKSIANNEKNSPVNHRILVRIALRNYLEKKQVE